MIEPGRHTFSAGTAGMRCKGTPHLSNTSASICATPICLAAHGIASLLLICQSTSHNFFNCILCFRRARINRQETIDLLQNCENVRSNAIAKGVSSSEAHELAKRVWNDWAATMLDKRRKLEDLGLWLTKSNDVDSLFTTRKGLNVESIQWIAEARASFNDTHFASKDFSMEPSPPIRKNAKTFSADTLNLSGFTFPGEVDFGNSTFYDDVDFSSSYFHGAIDFYEVKFCRGVDFKNAKFSGDARFNGAFFTRRAVFDDAVFCGGTRFDRAVFTRSARFSRTEFHEGAWFNQVSFNNYAQFRNARFKADARFVALHSMRNFSLQNAQFKIVPSFVQADFKQAPYIGPTTIPIWSFWRRGDEENIARYRALRRLAIQSHDYENEARAFKSEMRSRRFTVEWPWYLNFWFSVAYDLLSDFGKSTLRPIALLVLAFALFTITYIHNAELIDWINLSIRPCKSGTDNPLLLSTFLSLKNTLLFLGERRSDIEQVYHCLYGNGTAATAGNFNPSAFWQILQNLISGTFLFLAALGVRNLFKIK